MLQLGERTLIFYSGGDWTVGLNGLPYSIGYADCAGTSADIVSTRACVQYPLVYRPDFKRVGGKPRFRLSPTEALLSKHNYSHYGTLLVYQ